MPTEGNKASLGQRSVLADRVSRGLTGFNAFLGVIAFGNGIYTLFNTSPDHLIVEAWRAFGFLIFLILWIMITVWPRQVPGAWELIILHKVAITIFAIAAWDVAEAQRTALIDGWLVITIIPAYVLCRGWVAWRTVKKTPVDAGNLARSRP